MFAKLYGGQGPLTIKRISGRSCIAWPLFPIILNIDTFDEVINVGQNTVLRRKERDFLIFYQVAELFVQPVRIIALFPPLRRSSPRISVAFPAGTPCRVPGFLVLRVVRLPRVSNLPNHFHIHLNTATYVREFGFDSLLVS